MDIVPRRAVGVALVMEGIHEEGHPLGRRRVAAQPVCVQIARVVIDNGAVV